MLKSSLKLRDISLKEGYRQLHIDALKKVVNGKNDSFFGGSIIIMYRYI